MTIDEQLKQEYDNLPDMEVHDLNGEITIVKQHNPILFGRWLLKNCVMQYDDEGFLEWEYQNKEHSTRDLYVIFAELEKKFYENLD